MAFRVVIDDVRHSLYNYHILFSNQNNFVYYLWRVLCFATRLNNHKTRWVAALRRSYAIGWWQFSGGLGSLQSEDLNAIMWQRRSLNLFDNIRNIAP
jgi:hypothetical protein